MYTYYKVPIETSVTDPLRFIASLPDSDAQAIAILELTVRLRSKNAKATASNIYCWVDDHIKDPGYLSSAKCAGRAFANRQGDYTEFADLIVVLACVIDAPGALHHVIIRGIEWAKIFRPDFDRDNFIKRFSALLPETKTPSPAIIPGVCEKGIAEGCSPDLVGGGLLRSSGGWKILKRLRKEGIRVKGDERILGDGDFVKQVLE